MSNYDDIPNIVNVKYLRSYDLLVEFDNGEERVIDMSHSFNIPAALKFAPMSEFKKFKFNKNGIWWGDIESEDPSACMEPGKDSIYNLSTPIADFITSMFLFVAKYKFFPEDRDKPRSVPVDYYPELGEVKQPEELDQFMDTNSGIWVVPASASSILNLHSKKDTGSASVIFEIRNSRMPSGAEIIFKYDPLISNVSDIRCAISGIQTVECKLQTVSLDEIRQFMDLPTKEAAEFIKRHIKTPSPHTRQGVRLFQVLDDIISRG